MSKAFLICAIWASLVSSAFAAAPAARYTLKIPPAESTAFRLVQTSEREYAITMLGRRLFLLVRKGSSLKAPANRGMTGRLTNGVAVVRCPDFAGAGAVLEFTNGVLSRLSRKGADVLKLKARDEKMVRLAPQGSNPLLRMWSPKAEKDRDYWGYWTAQKGFDRLRLWFFNPNGAGTFFAELAILALAMLLLLRNGPLRAVGGVLFALFLWCELKTGSRGAFVGLMAGIALLSVFALKRSFSWKRGVVAAALAVAVAALAGFGAFGPRMGARLFALDWSNLERLRIWREVPRMLAAAPGGWGVDRSGAAFCDWFQNLRTFHPLVWLVNSHLTWIVELGWWFCGLYAFLWLAVLALAGRKAWCGDRLGMILAGLATVLFISAWFSTIGVFVTLWILPGIALVAFLVRGVRGFDRIDAILLVAAMAVAVVTPFAAVCAGRNMAPARDSVRSIARAGGITTVGEGAPEVYLVTDRETLSVGGGMGRDIRRWRLRHPKARTLGIADSVECLPPQMDRLVLAGRAGVDYLKLRQAHLVDGAYPRAKKLVFLSPSFPPSILPKTFVDEGSVKVVYGEFALRLMPGLQPHQLPSWVRVVKGAELYIPNWVRLAGVGGVK